MLSVKIGATYILFYGLRYLTVLSVENDATYTLYYGLLYFTVYLLELVQPVTSTMDALFYCAICKKWCNLEGYSQNLRLGLKL